MSVEVIGGKRIMARILQVKNALDPVSKAAGLATAEEIRDTAKELAPVGTPESTGKPGYIGGSLRASGRIQHFAKEAGLALNIGVSFGGYVTNPNTGKKVDYAKYVHEGTTRMVGRPFLKQAYDIHKGSMGEKLKRGLR